MIASVQNQLTPERVNIMLLSKQFAKECHEREKWFGTLYSCEGVCGEGGRGGEQIADVYNRGVNICNCDIPLFLYLFLHSYPFRVGEVEW